MITQYSITQSRITQSRITQSRDLLPTAFSLAKPYFWGMASQVEKDGSNYVSKMIDLSGNGNHPIQGTQINKPLWVDAELNSEPVLRFSGNRWLKIQFPSTIIQPISIFTVYSSDSGGPHIIYDGYSTELYLDTYINTVIMAAPGQLSYNKIAPFNYILNSLIYNAGSSKMYENAILKKEGAVGGNSMDGITVGAYHANAYTHIGDIAEIIIYNKLLSNQIRTNVENYLMNKYALL